MLKKSLIFLLIVVLAGAFWFTFAFWTGIYSVFSYPPSTAHPEGATLVVTREQGEPLFNSPDYVPPAQKPAEKGGTYTFVPQTMRKRPLEMRTIVELPYIEWAYKKSLEPTTGD